MVTAVLPSVGERVQHRHHRRQEPDQRAGGLLRWHIHPAWYLAASSTEVLAFAPFEFPGTVDVQVKTRVGISATSSKDKFTFRN